MNEKIYTFAQKEEYKNIINLIICGITYPHKSYSITRLNSSVACIEYIENGSGTAIIGNQKFFPSQGDSYFLQQNFDQHYFSHTNDPWKKYFINISGPLVYSFTESYGLQGNFYYPNLNIKDELLKIISIAKVKDRDCTSEIISILSEIFFKMHISLKTDEKNAFAIEMKKFINTRIESDFKIKDLCEHMHKSESQVTKIFKNAFGLTPYKYLLNEKINLSKELLKHTGLSVKEISDRLKFTDEYYFSNIFKKKVGLSPSVYRKTQSQSQIK